MRQPTDAGARNFSQLITFIPSPCQTMTMRGRVNCIRRLLGVEKKPARRHRFRRVTYQSQQANRWKDASGKFLLVRKYSCWRY
ncbi:hypothetical protein CEXT_208081 [Caerostris extrusa]|uniref:Uncharacterized protein n=1 Tax=Caerostris extrusa TaxID=172846 RepID=A0AAV4X907_CAEEX|nr:hypothetical protein CEXT_208081 [Caerostris extrusa]